MAAPKKPAKYDRLAGGTRKVVQLLPDLDQHRRLRLAAAASDQPIAHFVLESALSRAEKILDKIPSRG